METQILISSQRNLRGHNVQSGSHFNSHDIRLRRNSREGVSYYSLSDLSNTKGVEIYVEEDTPVEMPDLMKQRLTDYLAIEQNYGDSADRFDCFSFAHFMNDVDYPSFDRSKWDFTQLDEVNDLNPGDTICMSKSSNDTDLHSMTHFAISIGGDLFISKFGNKGRLIVTNLEQMQICFGGPFTYKVTPRI